MASYAAVHSLLQGNRGSSEPAFQFLEVQLRYYTLHLPLFEESSSSPRLHAIFSLPLFNDSSSFQTDVVESLVSLNLDAAVCDIIASRITEFSHQFINTDFTQFSIVACIDYLEIHCMDSSYVPQPLTAIAGESFREGASRSAIEKLKNGKFCGEEGGDCCVCCDEFGMKEVVRMGCGHVFHEACIVRWLIKKNSCPLCRRPLED